MLTIINERDQEPRKHGEELTSSSLNYNLPPEISLLCAYTIACTIAQLVFDFLIPWNSLTNSCQGRELTFAPYAKSPQYVRHIRSKVYQQTRYESSYSGSS